MSFNFTGTPVTTGSSGFSFGTPAGDAKTSKPGFSLFGSTRTTQSNDSFGFSSPPTGNITAGAQTLAQSAPLFGSSTFSSPFQSTPATLGTGSSMFGVNRATPSAFGITTTSAPLALGAPTIQPVRPSFGSTEESTFKTPSSSGLLGSSFQSFSTTSSVPESTAPSFGAPQSSAPSFGAPQSIAPSFGAPQSSAPSFGAPHSTAPSFGVPQTAAPSFGVPQSTAPSFGVPQSTAPSFGVPQTAAPSFGVPQSTAPSFGVPQSTLPTYGSTTQAIVSTAIGVPALATVPSFSMPAQPISAMTFGSPQPQNTSAAAPQFSFGSSMLAKPRIAVSAAVTPTSGFVPAISVPSFTAPKPLGASGPPPLSYPNLGPTPAVTAPAFPLGLAKVTMPNLTAATNTFATTVTRTVTSTAISTIAAAPTTSSTSTTAAAAAPISAVPAFGAVMPSEVPTSGSNFAIPALTTPHSTPNIADYSALTSSAKSFATSATGITAPGTTVPTMKFGTPTISTGIPNPLDTSSMAASTTAAVMTTGAGITVPPMKTNLATGSTITEAHTTETTAPIEASSSVITYGQLEDFINKWTLELENQSKIFANQAKQLNAWDRLLISNGDKILALNNSIEHVKEQQNHLDQELDFIRAQQKELEHLIIPLEKELQETPVTDTDRNHTYQLAENMDSQLKQMSEDLKEIIETLNESNKKQELTNPITQIGRILNAHMNSLQWIDINTNKISSQLDQISKMHDINRRNHEIVLQKTYE